MTSSLLFNSRLWFANVELSHQVVFAEENGHRRKSSLVPLETPRLARRHAKPDTACFVHSLLGQPSPPGANFTFGGSRKNSANVDDTVGNGSESPGSATESRLLTKKQLSDMAWNVRSLSKQLGTIKMRLNVQNVFILTKPEDECLVLLTREVTQWLLSNDHQTLYTVYVEKTLQDEKEFDTEGLYAENPSARRRLKFWDMDLVHNQPQAFDFVVTLGGDGTVLYASWLFQRVVPPVLSFSLGSLGFLTKFDFTDYRNTLWTAFRDGVTLSLRLRFECTIMRNKARNAPDYKQRDLVEELIGEESEDDTTHVPDRMFQILNDVVVDRGPNASM